MCKTSNKTTLIVLDHFIEIVLEELQLEVSQIETTIIVGGELVCHIQDNFIGVTPGHKSMRHGLSNFENLIVGRYKFIEV